MKRTRSLIIAVVVLLLLVVGIFVVKKVEKHVDSIQTVDESIINLTEDNITKFEWTYNDTTLAFEKSEDKWVYTEDKTFPVDQDIIANFLKDFEDVHASFIIEDIDDYGQYGLDEPQATIKFTLDSGELNIKLGGFSVMDDKRYVSIEDGKVYLIDDDLLEHVSVERDDFILNDKLTDFDQVTEYKVIGEGNADIVYDEEGLYTYTNYFDYYLVDGTGKKALSTTLAENFISNIADLNLSKFVTYNASNEDLSAYGLDNPAYTITVTGDKKVEEETKSDEPKYERSSYEVYVGYVIDTETAVKEGEEPAKFVYLRVADSELVYSVDESVLETLTKNDYASLRPENVLHLTKDDIVSIVANLEGTDYTITKEEAKSEDSEEKKSDGDETEMVYMLNGYEVDGDTIISSLNSLKVTDATSLKNGSEVEFKATINVNSDKYSEIKLVIYRYDGDSCYAEVNGEAVGLISRSSMVDARESFMKEILNLGKETLKEE